MILAVGGRSMEPSVPRSAQVRIVAADGDLRPGDVVVFQGRSRLVLHRVVHACSFGGRGYLFHRGDGGGRMGLAPRDAVVGRAVEIVLPEKRPMPSLDELRPRARAAFRAAQRRARLYAGARTAVERLGRARSRTVRAAVRWFWRLA